MGDWANVPAGKNRYDRLTRGGVTKYWRPGPFGIGGSYQTPETLNAERKREGAPPKDFSKIGGPPVKKPDPDKPKSDPVVPPATKPDPVVPPATKPPATKPDPVVPPATKPPATKPPATKPPAAAPKPQAPPVSFGKTMPAPASASLDKFKINKDWAAANPRLAQAEVKKAEQRAAGKSTFSSEFRKTTTNPILYKPGALKQEETMNKEPYDLVAEYLLSQGHVDTLEEAHYVMMEMDAEMIGDIVEDGFNSSGRYDVGGGRTVGPVAGAIRSLVTGNLPKSKTYVPPSKQTATNRPPATPASKGDSGKLTDFGAGGGRAKLKQGMTVGQVERQGRMNKGDYSG
jgi:hypothetical protein